MRFEVVEDLTGLREREPAWSALYRRLPFASVFTSPGWVMNWIESFAPGRPLHCVFASSGGDLRAVFPLAPVTMRWRRVPVTALVACTNSHSVRSALLCEPDARDAAFAALMDMLRERANWDILLLDGCEGAAAGHGVPPLPNELPIERWRHYCLTVRGLWADHLATLSRDLRRNLRRAERDLNAMGRIRFDVIEHDADRLFEQWVQVDRASWKANHGETVDSNAQTTEYYRRMVRGLAEQGQLFACVLLLDTAPIAVLVCLRDKGVVYTLKMAIRADLSSARLSLGAGVVARLLQTVWAQPEVKLIDFVNKKPYTECWTSEMLEFERRIAFAASWRGQAAALLERTYQRVARHRSPTIDPLQT